MKLRPAQTKTEWIAWVIFESVAFMYSKLFVFVEFNGVCIFKTIYIRFSYCLCRCAFCFYSCLYLYFCFERCDFFSRRCRRKRTMKPRNEQWSTYIVWRRKRIRNVFFFHKYISGSYSKCVLWKYCFFICVRLSSARLVFNVNLASMIWLSFWVIVMLLRFFFVIDMIGFLFHWFIFILKIYFIKLITEIHNFSTL